MTKENEIKMTCHNAIMMNVANMLNIVGKELDNFYTLFSDGVEIEWSDFGDYDLETPCTCECGEIVSVLMFGDGTIEFVFKDENEPTCWSNLTEKDISTLCKHIEKEHGNYLCKRWVLSNY